MDKALASLTLVVHRSVAVIGWPSDRLPSWIGVNAEFMGLDKVDVVHDVAISLGGATAGLGDCCAYPVADRTQDGLLVCIYRCGAETQTYDGIPVARTSRDRGKTWSDPVVLFDGRSLDPPESVLNPQVVVVPDGSLLALFQAVVATRPDEDPFRRSPFCW